MRLFAYSFCVYFAEEEERIAGYCFSSEEEIRNCLLFGVYGGLKLLGGKYGVSGDLEWGDLAVPLSKLTLACKRGFVYFAFHVCHL